MIHKLILTESHWLEIVEHVQSQVPMEACGLLAGKDGRVEKMIAVQNQAQSPVRFVMNPYEQLQAFEWIESHNLELVGIFHSHPTGPQTASPTDIAEASYEVVHLIVSPGDRGWVARGYWIDGGESLEVPLVIVR